VSTELTPFRAFIEGLGLTAQTAMLAHRIGTLPEVELEKILDARGAAVHRRRCSHRSAFFLLSRAVCSQRRQVACRALDISRARLRLKPAS
jgi:hypothetical protein